MTKQVTGHVGLLTEATVRELLHRKGVYAGVRFISMDANGTTMARELAICSMNPQNRNTAKILVPTTTQNLYKQDYPCIPVSSVEKAIKELGLA